MKIMNVINEEISLLFESNKFIDKILDKISATGYDDLSDYEKDALNAASKGIKSPNPPYNAAIDWLDDNFSNLKTKVVVLNVWNRDVEALVFFDDNKKEVMTIFNIPNDRSILISYELVWDRLFSYFGFNEEEAKDVLSSWLEKTYKLSNTHPKKSFGEIKE